MGADREMNHDMTDSDIAFLLADAADGVEIGTAPTQAVIRGGRRRRARRWAVATAAALTIVGATGTLAVAGLRDGDGDRVGPVATRPPSPTARHVDEPRTTSLAAGTDRGRQWEVYVEVWDAPRDRAEAQAQFAAMAQEGLWPDAVAHAAELTGKSSFFVRRVYGDGRPQTVMFNTVTRFDRLTGADFESAAVSLTGAAHDSGSLVVGQVSRTARQVTCHWKNGTSTVVHRGTGDVNGDDTGRSGVQGIVPAAGMPADWFVCVAPEGTASKSVQVTG